MPKYVDVDALKINKRVPREFSDPGIALGWNMAAAIIDATPAADVEPVVRCKNCKHRDPEDHKCDSGRLERAGCIFAVDDNYFCADGERKEATMPEYINDNPKAIAPGEPIVFENLCESPVEVGAGVVFREDGDYVVSVHNGIIRVLRK